MSEILHFERKKQPLLPRRHYYSRLVRNVLLGVGILIAFWSLGALGYHLTCFEDVARSRLLNWPESFLNAAMILSGMGPLVPVQQMTESGMWFASIYAIISGVIFISTIGLVLAPVAHRMLHRFHLEEDEDNNTKPRNAGRSGAS